MHGYAPIRGLARTKEAIAARYRDVYGVELDPEREVALIPGTKTGDRRARARARDEGDTILLPDPYYPDYPSGPALAGARLETVPAARRRTAGRPTSTPRPQRQRSTSTTRRTRARSARRPASFEDAVRWAERTGGAVVHDAAYIDIVFDGRAPQSFLATPGAKDVGVEMWSMSKTYGMAGWRIGFVVGNAEIVERINLLNDHARVGIFAPMQRAAIAALEGPQDSVAAARRRATSGAATRSPPRCRSRSCARARSSSGCGCPKD